MVELPSSVLGRYRYWSLYNSPYDAHNQGCAIDLYPDGQTALSPVAGQVVETRTVQAPPKPYAAEHDYLIVVDTSEAPRSSTASDADSPDYRTEDGDRPLARLLHIDPAVEPGDQVAVGDDLGDLVRAGFFAPWVDNHIHLGFRSPDDNPVRASGSLPLAVDVSVTGRAWDGTGTVVETGDTYALLDAPDLSGNGVFGIAADNRGVLDGGLPHYDGGGVHGVDDGTEEPVELLGTTVGYRTGRTVEWTEPTVLVDGESITGLSLFLTNEDRPGVKLICPDRQFSIGENVVVEMQ